jgi:hypothetical protein
MGFRRNPGNCKTFHFLSLFGRSGLEVFDRFYRVLTKSVIFTFPHTLPDPILDKESWGLGEILGTAKRFTFYYFLGALDWRYSTGFIGF